MTARRSLCPVCGSSPRALAGTCPDAWICPRCAHTFIGTLPTPAELDAAYAKYRYDDAAAREKEVPAYLDAILAGVVRSFEPHRKTGRFLDVGFGDGGFLRTAKKLGWDPFGVEFSEDAVAAARARSLGTLFVGDLPSAPLEDGTFDVVVMSEVIEHLLDPAASLARAARLLRPGGILYMTTPHGRGLSGRLLRGSWSVLCPPEHLQLYSTDSMRRSLVTAGFRRPRVYTQGLLPHEILAKLRKRELDDRVGDTHDLNARLESGPVARAVKTTANAVLRLSGQGDSLRVRAVR